ncbi:hypothetical protein HK099_006465 [Clydaea vesicula]|uniref:K Homology domain-containing protein n=1 Tax=Clydaea vesicula TaxID=447962 RepID=A0AAD5Y0V6_9FUNG|nr:hypothetical protein HK099_006465 [Clydaea vesicula]
MDHSNNHNIGQQQQQPLNLLTKLQNRLHPDSTHDYLISPPSHDLDFSPKPPSPTLNSQIPVQQQIERQQSTSENSTSRLDLKNEDAFPSLAPSTHKVSTTSWAKPAVLSAGKSGKIIGSAAVTAAKKKVPNQVTDRFEIPSHAQAKHQSQLGAKSGAPGDICRGISSRTGTNIDISSSKMSGNLTVIISGTANDVKQAKREVQNALCKQITVTLNVPSCVRPHILGAGGKTLKALIARTMTKINIPKADTNKSSEEEEDSFEEQPITIIGDYEGVETAKTEIEAIVTSRTSRSNSKLIIDRQFHPFIAGVGGSTVQLVMLETNTKIHVPPLFLSKDSEKSQGKNLNEIVIIGDRKDIAVAAEKLNNIYEQVRQSTNTLVVSIKKRSHKFVIGLKGSGLQNVFAETGCFVEMPPASDSSDVVTIRGPSQNLSKALNLVMEMATSTRIAEIDIPSLLSKSTDPNLFIKYLYSKHRATLKNFESTYSATIIPPQENANILEIQSKTDTGCQSMKEELQKFIKELSTDYFFSVVEIPRNLHKFVIGKGGANIVKLKAMPECGGRILDIIVPQESDESDEVIIVAKLNKEAAKSSQTEVMNLIGKVHEQLISFATNLAEYGVKNIIVDAKYHGKLIGSKGEKLKELLGPLDGSVVVKFQSSKGKETKAEESNDPHTVIVKGPLKEAEEVADKILKVVAEWRHNEVMNSFEEKIKVPKNLGKKLLNGGGNDTGSGIYWLIKSIKEYITANDKHHQYSEKDLSGNLALKADLDESNSNHDIIHVVGPKHVVSAARVVLEERSVKIADIVEVEVKIFDEVSSIARKELKFGNLEEIQSRVRSRIIGKGGKAINKFSQKHDISVKFQSKRSEEDDEENDDQGTVKLKGIKGNVERAKKDLLELVEFEETHDVRVDFNDVLGENDEELIETVVEGSKENCETIKRTILNQVDDQASIDTRTVQIPSYMHKQIIGPSGSRIKKIIDQFGGNDKIKIQFPAANHKGSKSANNFEQDAVIIQAHKDLLPEIEEQIKNLVSSVYAGQDENDETILDESSIVEQVISIPRSDIGQVIDRGGRNLKDLMSRFGVNIWISDVDSKDADVPVSVVRIVSTPGKEEEVENAKNEILSKLRVSKHITLPTEIVECLNSSEKDIEKVFLQEILKRISSESGVSADLNNSSDEVILRGESKNVKNASKEFEAILKKMAKLSVTRQVKVASSLSPHVIGRNGFTINKIRNDSGCLISIIKGKASNVDLIVIKGTEKSSSVACAAIEKIIKAQEIHQQRDQERAAAAEDALKKKETSSLGKNSPARIDDEDFSSNDGSDQLRSIPGLTNKKGTSQRNVRSAPQTVVQSEHVPIRTSVSSFKKEEQDWQQVKPRYSTKGAEDGDVGEEALEKSKKKNKKKNKKSKATSESSQVGEKIVEEIPVTTPKPSSSSPHNKKEADALTPAALKKPLQQDYVAKKQSATANIAQPDKVPKSEITKAVPPTVTESKKIISSIEKVSLPFTPKVDDWQTVETKKVKPTKAGGPQQPVVQTANSVVTDSIFEVLEPEVASSGKKKRKNKKKKIQTNGVSNEDEQD